MSSLKIHRKKKKQKSRYKYMRGEPNIFQNHLIDLLKITCHTSNMPISIRTFNWFCYNRY